MPKYCYYNPETMQVEAEFNMPNLVVQANWADKGLSRAIIPEGMIVTRDCVITELTADGVITDCQDSLNPVQPVADLSDVRLMELMAKLEDDSISDIEIREMLKLERGLKY